MFTESSDSYKFNSPNMSHPNMMIYWNKRVLGVASSFEIRNTTKYREFEYPIPTGIFTSKVPMENIVEIFFSLIVDQSNFSDLKEYFYGIKEYEIGKLKIIELESSSANSQLVPSGVLMESTGFLHLSNAVIDYIFGNGIYKIDFKFTSSDQLNIEIPKFDEIVKTINSNDFIEKPILIKKKDEKIYKRKISF